MGIVEKSGLDGQLKPCKDGPQESGASGVTFADNAITTAIQNFRSHNLWYPKLSVQCDKCEQPVAWGKEGKLVGAPGRSSFSHWQVLCNGCLSDRIYMEIGAWFVVALAAVAGSKAQSNAVHGPV